MEEQKGGDIYTLHDQLCQHLMQNNTIRIVCYDFNSLTTNCARVKLVRGLLEKYKIDAELLTSLLKNDKIAIQYREKGNELFKLKKDIQAWEMYTKSLAFSESGSETLGLAYANRSAVLFELGLYNESLTDINHSLLEKYPEKILQKLLQRKDKCEKVLNDQININFHFEIPKLDQKSDFIECASSCVEIKNSENYGRYVVATRDIATGEVIAIEKPYTKILLQDRYYTHCHNCIKYNLNLIPCDNCAFALFCSTHCKQEAWESYHKYECRIIPTLNYLEVNKLTLAALRISIMARNHYKNLNFIQEDCYKSGRYEEVHKLIANTDKRSTNDLFERSVIAAIIYGLVKNHTSFFDDLPDRESGEEAFQELLLLHMQTAPSNFHEISQLVITGTKSKTVEIGCGVYAFLSLINHACSPNVVRICYGANIVLRALKPIAKGEQLFDNYGYHHCLMSKEERKKVLSKQYYFNCDCPACVNDWPLYFDLEKKKNELNISSEELSSLQKADVTVAEEIMNLIIDQEMEKLSLSEPSKELSDAQEILKQCMKIFGNKVILF